MVEWAGHEPVRFASVSDSLDSLRSALNEAASTCDVILTSGGVSMGEFDYVRRLMEDEGDIHFWRMKIRPGSPPLFGLWNTTPLFGLPGNPVSSHVVFRMLVAPYLRSALGADGPREWTVRARLCDRVKSSASTRPAAAPRGSVSMDVGGGVCWVMSSASSTVMK